MQPLRVMSISGGKDSTALYLWAIEQFGKDGFKAVFADTNHEHPVTLNYLRNLPTFAKGPDVCWVRADFTERLKKKAIEPTGNAYLDMLLWKKMMPSGKHQFCTTHLKLEPVREYLEEIRQDQELLLYLGIRAEESLKRSKLPMEEDNDYYDCKVIRPLLHWKLEEVYEMHRKHAVPLNPLYELGMSRVGCFPCINANKSDLSYLPEWAWQKIELFEKRLGLPFFKPGLVKANPTATLSEIKHWCKTKHGGHELDPTKADINDVPTCMSTWGICD